MRNEAIRKALLKGRITQDSEVKVSWDIDSWPPVDGHSRSGYWPVMIGNVKLLIYLCLPANLDPGELHRRVTGYARTMLKKALLKDHETGRYKYLTVSKFDR